MQVWKKPDARHPHRYNLSVRIISRQKAIYFFITLGVCLIAAAVALNVSWVILYWREGLKLFFGGILFLVIIAGLVLNTIFLVREIRRNEQHDSFINAVTHELKTPIASIRLYLQTLQRREVEESQRRQFYELMLLDTERLLHTVEQVLKAAPAPAGGIRCAGAGVRGTGANAASFAGGGPGVSRSAVVIRISIFAERRWNTSFGRCGGVADGGFKPAGQRREVLAGWRAHLGRAGCSG
jgi:hypothetical protein